MKQNCLLEKYLYEFQLNDFLMKCIFPFIIKKKILLKIKNSITKQNIPHTRTHSIQNR